MRTRALLLMTLALFAPTLRAQNQTVPASAEKAPNAEASAQTPEVKIKDETVGVTVNKSAKEGGSHDTISVDFPDEEIRTILRSVADLFELNLVIPDTLQGKTSVKLRDVSWRQIFQVVLAPVNYTYLEDNNIIKIVSNESLQQEPTTTEVFILNYARASDIMPTVASLVEAGAGGKIVVDSRSNSLVITERPSRLARVRPIIENLDRATDQVMIESKFIEVTDGDVRNLGVKWSSLEGVNVSSGSMSKTYSQGRNQSYSSGNNSSGSTNGNRNTINTNTANGTTTVGGNSTVSNGTTLTAEKDSLGNPTGNFINVPTATSVNTTTNISSNGTTSSLSDALTSTSSSVASSLASLAHGGSTGTTTSAVFSATDFNVLLSALTTLNNTKIVSNPTIVTLNNTEATINVGEEFPIPNYTYNQERGTFEVSGFVYRPIGINLKVTPQVNSRGFVKLNIEPEVSQRNGNSTFSGAEIPIIATRKAKTQVSLKDGYTMGIGGLIKKQDIKATTKVPLLGDIPFIGNLFKHTNNDKSVTNLLIFITAKVVSADGAAVEQVVDPRQIREMKLDQGDLPGYREKDTAFAPMPVQKKDAKDAKASKDAKAKK